MNPGLYEMPEKDYRALPFLNFSRFKPALDSPKKARFLDQNPAPTTAPMLFGSLSHCCLLTPEETVREFVAHPQILECQNVFEKGSEGWTVNGEGPFRTKKEAQDFAPRYELDGYPGRFRTKADAKAAVRSVAEGRRVVSREDIELAFRIADAVEAHDFAGPLLDDSTRREFVAIWDEKTLSGVVRCKARIDGYAPERGVVWDFKTVQSANPSAFRFNNCRRYHYHAQIAFYARGMREAAAQAGIEAPRIESLGFVCAEKVEPFEVCAIFLRPAAARSAELLALKGLETWMSSEKSGIWKDKHPDPVWIDI